MRFLRWLLWWLFCSKRTEKVYTRLIRENVMGLIYEVVMPEVLSPDVVSRELEVHVAGEIFHYEVGASATTFVLPPMNEGVNVTILLRDKDDAGNFSDWSEPYSFDTKDTIKPKMPGAVAVNLIDEVAVAETEPAPVVEETVVEPVSEDTVDLPPDHVVKF